MVKMNSFVRFILLSVLFAIIAAQQAQKAVCVLSPTASSQFRNIQGTLFFDVDPATNAATMSGTITGLPVDTTLGFHVHEFGNLGSSDGLATGGHFNPTNAPHGFPGELPRHIGDMGNITTNSSGAAVVSKSSANGEILWTLQGNYSIIGRAIIVHARRDNGSQPVGDAGARLAQCVIGIRKVGTNWTENAAVFNTEEQVQVAVCEMKTINTASFPYLSGRIIFETSGTDVRVRGRVCNLTANWNHGFHVHEFGDISAGPTNTGDHWNPFNQPHGFPSNPVRHAGDMGNISTNSVGTAEFNNVFSILTLKGQYSIVGRLALIHSGGDTGVQPLGAAGAKIGACVIGYTKTVPSLDDIVCPTAPPPTPTPIPSRRSAATSPFNLHSYVIAVGFAFAFFFALAM